MCAAKYGNLEALKILVQARANVNYQTQTGVTALMCAANHGYLEVVKALLAAGADPNIQDSVVKNNNFLILFVVV